MGFFLELNGKFAFSLPDFCFYENLKSNCFFAANCSLISSFFLFKKKHSSLQYNQSNGFKIYKYSTGLFVIHPCLDMCGKGCLNQGSLVDEMWNGNMVERW